jgi:general secretion pathway protein J
VDQRLQRMDDLRVASGFLQQVLGRVSGRKQPAPQGQGGQQVAFRATPTSIEWVGIMPARHGMGGRYFFRLQPENVGTGLALVLRFSPWDAAAPTFPDWSQAPARTLVPVLGQFAVQAEGRPTQNQTLPPEWPTGWVPGWPVSDQLPQRLRISWGPAGLVWPDLVVPIQNLTQGGGFSGGIGFGGGQL